MYRLKECREMRGLSQKEVAATLKVSAPSVSNWESEKTRPTHDNLEKLADLYGVSVDYLLGRDVPAEAQKEKPVPKDELSDDERELLRLFHQPHPYSNTALIYVRHTFGLLVWRGAE